MALYSGESFELVNNIKPAAQIVRDLMLEAKEALRRVGAGSPGE